MEIYKSDYQKEGQRHNVVKTQGHYAETGKSKNRNNYSRALQSY
jgi:hypothetical protein